MSLLKRLDHKLKSFFLNGSTVVHKYELVHECKRSKKHYEEFESNQSKLHMCENMHACMHSWHSHLSCWNLSFELRLFFASMLKVI